LQPLQKRLNVPHSNTPEVSMRFLSNAFVSACAIALLSFAATAVAEETQQQPPAAEGQTAAPAEPAAGPTAPAEDPNEIICKKVDADFDTRLGRRKNAARAANGTRFRKRKQD
jgi:hypothetical protein